MLECGQQQTAAWRRRLSGALLVAVLTLASSQSAASAQGREWCGEINSNTVWAALSGPHHVTCDVVVRNSQLKIDPGSIVLFHAGTNLTIDDGASLEAVGLESSKIRFQALDDDVNPGFWGQIRFEDGAGASRLEFVIVQDGGQGGAPMVESRGAVVAMGAEPAQDVNVRMANAGGAPLALTANEVGPSLATAGQSAVGQVCKQVRLEASNVDNVIQVIAPRTPDITDLQTWHDFCVPYAVDEELVVAGETIPKLILDSLTMRFGPEGSLVVGLDEDQPGQLETTAGVTFTGTVEEPGAWLGIDISEFGPSSSFGSAVIQYGGRGGRPMVRVRSLDTIAFDTTFRNALGYPLELRVAGVESFIDGLTVGESAFVDNGTQKVRVLVDAVPAIEGNVRWGGIGIPYELTDSLVLAGPAFGPSLRLFDGATLQFPEGKGIVVGDETLGAGSLDIDGIDADPVVVEGVTDAPGGWGGIQVGARADQVMIRGSVVRNGGSESAAMIRWLGGRGSITSTVLSGAPGYPLEVAVGRVGSVVGDCRPADPNPDDPPVPQSSCVNQVEGNGTDRFLVTGELRPGRGLLEWFDPGAPIELTDSIIMEASGATRLDLKDGVELLFRAGKGIHAGSDTTKQAEVFLNDADDRDVRLGAADPAAGWAGVVVMPGSTIRGSGAVLEGGAAGSATVTLRGGHAELEEVLVRGSAGAGIAVEEAGGLAEIERSEIRDNAIGIVARSGGMLRLRESTVQGNTEWGVLNEHEAFCIDAIRVFWGRQAGPDDPSAAPDNCMTASNASPGADKVSDFVDWWPYATNPESYPPAPGLGPNPKRIYLPIARRDG